MTDDEPVYLDAHGVAARANIKYKSVIEYCRRRLIPEPDLVWLGQKLWLVDTIDQWRALKYKPLKERPMLRRRVVASPKRGQFPKVAKRPTANMPTKKDDNRLKRRASMVGASVKPAESKISEHYAREIAAALRAEGHYVTTADVMVLASIVDDSELEHERRQLCQRIRQKMRSTKGH